MNNRSVTLREIRDKSGLRYLGARLAADGTLTVEGQDLGDGVEQVFGTGNREYEWAWTIQPEDVAKLLIALDCGNDDILDVLAKRFSNGAAAELQPFFDAQGIRYESWSRIGD